MAKREGEGRGPVRCAIYTRKSTEEGLEQDYNRLDAQYDACAAYIMSQRHERWTLVRDRYDDGGFSGGTMERPGLNRLLADVAAGKVDIIVLYKIDRLTRSLSDFSRIVEVLEKASASFVSVTQQINTTTSMGRLMLNVLLSFAQFERELTGERIRDKVAAAKRKGLWMGGPVPLGYRVETRKLVIDEAEAAQVRHIFDRYLALRSGAALIDELRRDGYRTAIRPRAGQPTGGIAFARGALFHLLKNRVYVGEIVHQEVGYPGEHPAIITPDVFEAVQRLIAANRNDHVERRHAAAPSLLAGLIRDGHVRPMTPSHAVRHGKRYRYYVTHANALRDGEPPAWRVPAHQLEKIVTEQLAALLRSATRIRGLIAASDAEPTSAAITAASMLAERLATSPERRRIIAALVERIDVSDEALSIMLAGTGVISTLGAALHDDAALVITCPTVRIRRGNDVKLMLVDERGRSDQPEDGLVALLAEAHATRALVLGSPHQSIKAIATAHGRCRFRMAQLLRLAFLAPDIVAAILDGRHPARMSKRQLLGAALPTAWVEQRVMLEVG